MRSDSFETRKVVGALPAPQSAKGDYPAILAAHVEGQKGSLERIVVLVSRSADEQFGDARFRNVRFAFQRVELYYAVVESHLKR